MTGKEDSTSTVSKKTPSDLPVVPASSPTECPSSAEASAMLAKEMNQLSVKEREKILEDVHGIARVADEPQEFIEACLALLDKELDSISNKAAYDLASSMSNEYTSSKTRRLMFLRAESFDPCKAASRMVRFFDEKCELFGADKLTKDITLNDLDPDDIAALEGGCYQVLPEKDSAGRKVFCYFPKLRMTRTSRNALRAYYYIVMRTMEDDEEVQKRGVVGCVYDVGGGIGIELELIRKAAKLRNSLPARFNSVHVCYSDSRSMLAFSLGMLIMGTHSRMRFRAHYGSDEECQSKLSTFGIPIPVLPVSPRGEINLENHWAYMARERAIEATKSQREGPLIGVAQKTGKKPEEKARSRQPIIEEDIFVAVPEPVPNEPTGYGGFMSFNNSGFLLPQPSFATPWWNVLGVPNSPLVVVPPQRQLQVVPPSHTIGPTSASRPPSTLCRSSAKAHVIYDPSPNDILLGRGKPIQQRPGNVRFRDMLDQHVDKYNKSEKGAKVAVTASIVHLLKEDGGRFLKPLEYGGWVEVDEAAARAKVSHAFRTRRKVFQATLKRGKSTA